MNEAPGATVVDKAAVRTSLVKDSILGTIGSTPIIKLSKLFPDSRVEVYGKLEALNPGGSIKDRPAYNIVTKGIADGTITPETTIVESSSGNFAIGLAQMCAYLG